MSEAEKALEAILEQVKAARHRNPFWAPGEEEMQKFLDWIEQKAVVALHKPVPEPTQAPEKITPKRYKCDRCGHVQTIQTNHYGPCWSYDRVNTCPSCPPWAKYPEFGGCTTWTCLESPPEVQGTGATASDKGEAAPEAPGAPGHG